MMKIADVMVACDVVECGYRIVELEDSRFAFVWGNVKSGHGDVLPQRLADDITADRGVEVFDTFEAALAAYRRCAETLQQTSSKAGDEMLDVLDTE